MRLSTYLLCGVLALAPAPILLTSCTTPITTTQQANLHAEVDALRASGSISDIQAAWLHAQIDEMAKGGGVDWGALGETLLAIGGAVGAALFGVRITRGPAKPMEKSQTEVLREMIESARKAKQNAES